MTIEIFAAAALGLATVWVIAEIMTPAPVREPRSVHGDQLDEGILLTHYSRSERLMLDAYDITVGGDE